MTKSPNPIDIHVGSRVRLRRMLVGMSQEKLGEQLSLTFQQIQKYEKGANRIGASRLFKIASILGVPVQFFFDDMPAAIESTVASEEQLAEMREAGDGAFVMDFVNSSEGLQLNTAFSKIANSDTKRKIVDLVKTLAAAETAYAAQK